MTTTENNKANESKPSLLEKVDHVLDPMDLIGRALDAASNADYTRETRVTSDTKEHVQGHNTHVDSETDTHVELSGDFDNRVMHMVNGQIQEWAAERKRSEDIRANKRNFNRMMTLLGALVIGLVVTFVLTTPGLLPPSLHFLAPYTFVITIVLDAGLALYGYIRKY